MFELLGASEDLEITQEEVTTIAASVIDSAMSGFVIVGIMSILVREFYGILGPKKYAKQEAEVLKMVEEIW